MIYQIKRGSTVIFEHEIRGNRTQSAPAVDFVDIEFDYKEAILFKNNDTIDFDGETYYCDKQYNSVLKKSTNLYNHRARFLSENYRATEIALLDPQGLHIFEIEGNLLTLLTLAVNRLNAVSSGWSYDTPPTTVTKTFQIDGQNVMEFLARVSSEFEIPFYIQDKVIYYKDPALVDAGNFEYGKGNGFLDIRKSYKSGEKIPNTVYASGGDDLVLDAPVVNSGDVASNGVIEGFYSNENIKPTTRVYMEGVVTADNVVTTTQINYDIQAQKIAGQTPLINFETGALGGLSFYITNSTYDTNTNVTVIYLKKRTVDGELLPNNTVRALAGDYFNITNIRQPQIIVDEALFKLGQYATADMNNRILNNMGIEVSLDPLFPEDLKLNDSITVIDDNLELAGRFFILEIKTDLQNLNKKDLVLGRNFRYLNIPGLNVKNDNIIDLGIQNNYDDLVVIEEEVNRVKVDVNDLRIKNAELGVVVADLDVSVEAIKEIDLPSKENINNKVSDLERTDARYYPTVTAVNSGLLLKQNKLVQGNNININQTTNTISVPNATSTQAGVVQTFSNTVQNVGANSITSVANRTYGVQNNASGQLVVNVPFVDLGLGTANGLQLSNNVLSLGLSSASTNGALSASDWTSFNNKLDANDLDGFVYNATYNTTTHVLTLFRQNAPNVVIDFPTEDLIANIDVVGNDLVITFQDGTTKSIPLNTLLVGVVKSVNGLTPNSNGEIVLQLTDIPNLSSELANKLDVRMTGLVSNLTQPEKDAILSKLGVINNVVQVLSLNSNTISLSGGGGSVSLGIVNIGGLDNALNSINIQISNKANVDASNISITNVPIWRNVLDVYSQNDANVLLAGKANTSGNYQGLSVGNWGVGYSNGFGGVSGITNIDYGYFYNSSTGVGHLLTLSDVKDLLDIEVVNNGSIEYTGTGSITGGGISSANQSGNTSYAFDLTTQTKSDIALGVSASNTLPTKANINGDNLVNINDWRDNLEVYSTIQVDNFLLGKANTSGNYPLLYVGGGDNWGNGYNNIFSGVSGTSGIDYLYGYNSGTGKGHILTIADFQTVMGLGNYALLSQVPTNVSQLVNDANYTTLPIVQSWIGTQNFSTQTLTAGANVQIVGNVISATDTNTTYSAGTGLSLIGTTFTNTAPNVQADWNATSGLSQILNKPTIPSQLVYTGSNGINVTGTVISPAYGTTAGTIAEGNDARILNGQTAFGWGNHAGLYPLLSGSYANPTWITSLDWSKISNKPTIPNAPNNGTFTVQGTGALTGTGSTSANASVNTTAQLDLAQATKDAIQQGVDVYNEFPSVKEGVSFNNVSTPLTTNISISTKKTIVNISAGVINGTVQVEDGLYDGYELAFNGCGEWSIDVEANIQDKCGNKGIISLTGDSALFWWSVNDAMWIQAI